MRRRHALIRQDLLAGLGSAGSLVAAAVATASLLGGVVAFSAWPDDAQPEAPAAEVRLEVDAPGATVLDAPRRAAGSSATGTATPPPVGAAAGALAALDPATGGAAAPAGSRSVVGASTERPAVAAGDAGSPATTPTPAPSAPRTGSPLAPVADAARDAALEVSVAVDGGATELSADLTGLAPNTARAVGAVGDVAGEALRRSGEAVAGVLGGGR